jgi:oligopeptidase B
LNQASWLAQSSRSSSNLLLLLLVALLLTGCWSEQADKEADLQPPVAEPVPRTLVGNGFERQDEYYWLRDDERSDPAVLALLKAENQYTRSMMAPLSDLQDQLFGEITARFTEDDKTVPVTQGAYAYHREFQSGGEYPVYLRAKLEAGAAPKVILDVNLLAQTHLEQGGQYYQVSNWSVSSADNLLAFTEDTVGRRIYTLRFKDLESGEFLPDQITGVSSSIIRRSFTSSLTLKHCYPIRFIVTSWVRRLPRISWFTRRQAAALKRRSTRPDQKSLWSSAYPAPIALRFY